MWENHSIYLEDKFTDPLTLYIKEVLVQETFFHASKLYITGPDITAYTPFKNFTPESCFVL